MKSAVTDDPKEDAHRPRRVYTKKRLHQCIEGRLVIFQTPSQLTHVGNIDNNRQEQED